MSVKKQPTVDNLSAALQISSISAEPAPQPQPEPAAVVEKKPEKVAEKATAQAKEPVKAGAQDAPRTRKNTPRVPGMRRISVELTEDDYMKLKMEAVKRNTTVATLIREFVETL